MSDKARAMGLGQIETAETWYHPPEEASMQHPATWVPLTTWPRRAGEPEHEPPTPEGLASKAASKIAEVAAYVNYGRWMVECPHCSSAQVASVTDKRFMCVHCHNVAFEGQWLKVRWPKEKDRLVIEEILLCRPYIENRHWVNPETLDDLRKENMEHDLPVSL